jgi:hypothetical protein
MSFLTFIPWGLITRIARKITARPVIIITLKSGPGKWFFNTVANFPVKKLSRLFPSFGNFRLGYIQYDVRKELRIPAMEKTANCRRMGKGAKKKIAKQISVETKHMIMLFEIYERIAYPSFMFTLAFQ